MLRNFTLTLILGFFIHASILFAQEKPYKVACIGFYNLENLFDTIDDPNINDEEYLPNGVNKWNTEKYFNKLNNMSKVIAQLGDELVKTGPSIVGVCEIENRTVLEDLIKTPPLKDMNYDIVHVDGPDRRGVDVALLYQPEIYKVTHFKSVRLYYPKDTSFRTRDQLVVSGIFDGEPLHVIVNHWPSRRGGEKHSAPLRAAAAKLVRSSVDSLMKIDPNAKIIIMGDLNDDPTDASVIKHLGAKCKLSEVKDGDLYNVMCPVFTKEGVGSLAYRDSWNLFDQIIVSSALLGKDKSTYKFYKAKVFNRPFITKKDGQYAGYPLRTHAGGVYQNGYSDHFPTYIFIVKEKN